MTGQQSETSVAVVVETIKEFVNFHYEVELEEKRIGNTIHLKILGLHAPSAVMPGVGPARGMRIHPRRSGQMIIILTKPDGEENTFEFDIDQTAIRVIRLPDRPFAIFSPEPLPLN